MPTFKPFAEKIANRFADMQSHARLFVVGSDNREIEQVYLDAFPAGTNPVYKVNTEYDCSCCKNFLRNLGTVVAIVGDSIETVWDVDGLEYPFNIVAEKLQTWVKSQPITAIFASPELKYGNKVTRQLSSDNVINWNHFYGVVSNKHYAGDNAASVVGKYNTNMGVFERGLCELTVNSLDDIIDMVERNALYRGDEYLQSVRDFKSLILAYNTSSNQSAFVWANAGNHAALFRNTVIGTLAQDISSGVDTEGAVRSFETKVAPTNYKRPTALITQSMIADAMKTIDTLGLEQSLHRRHAVISDVSVNDVLWVNNETKRQMKGALENLLLGAVSKPSKKPSVKIEIGINTFMETVVPSVREMEVLVEGNHLKNLMSVTAPMHSSAPNLFKWDNDFAWSYNGNITDSIRERVKAAGGNVTTANLRFSLAWFNKDDLDIHVLTPNGDKISYYNKMGALDVDMNICAPIRGAVENVSFTRVVDGRYEVYVDNYNRRESDLLGATVEIESKGKIYRLSTPAAIGKMVKFATVTVSDGIVSSITSGAGISMQGIPQDVWGIRTESYVPVETIMHSPNYWGENASGNKHHFFILKGCQNPDPVRGFYNEFLSPNLTPHRKVFEVLGNKMMCAHSADQLSGVGFSSTNNDQVTILTRTEKSTNIYTVQF